MKKRCRSALPALLSLLLAVAPVPCAHALAGDAVAELAEETVIEHRELLFLPVNNDAETLALPTAEALWVDLPELPETGIIYQCPVVWDYTGLDVSTPGRKTLTGRLAPEAGYEGVSGRVEQPVLVTSSGLEATPLRRVQLNGDAFYLTAVGELLPSELTQMQLICDTDASGEYFTCPAQWDLSELDMESPGVYPVYGTPVLPDGISLPEGFSPAAASVGVVSRECVDLSAAYSVPGNSDFLVCQWLYEPQDRASMILQVSVDGGGWTAAAIDEWGVVQYGTISRYGTSLTLEMSELELNTDYAFRILYNGKQTSNELRLRITDYDFTRAFLKSRSSYAISTK